VRFFNKFQAQSRGGVLSIIADYIHQNTVYSEHFVITISCWHNFTPLGQIRNLTYQKKIICCKILIPRKENHCPLGHYEKLWTFSTAKFKPLNSMNLIYHTLFWYQILYLIGKFIKYPLFDFKIRGWIFFMIRFYLGFCSLLIQCTCDTCNSCIKITFQEEIKQAFLTYQVLS
jgi:hypothetical protein